MQRLLPGQLSPALIETLAKCIDHLGAPDFPGLLSEFCKQTSNAEHVYLCAFFDHAPPVALYSSHTDPKIQDNLDLYLKKAYILDPFYSLFKEKKESEVVRFDEFAPDDFKNSDYYLKFYKDMNLQDECGLMLHLEKDSALFFSFGSYTTDTPVQKENLAMILPLVASLSTRHWTSLSPEQTEESSPLAGQLEAIFNAFGSSVLSPRECEILQLILKGHSSKAIANKLGNSPETIKVHRKRIYAKLGITSQGELLSTFLTALSQTPAEYRQDPLLCMTPQS